MTRHTPFVLTLLVASCLLATSAQATDIWLWLVDADENTASEQERLLSDILSRDPDRQHLVGRSAIEGRLRTAPQLPACARGVGTCPHPDSSLLRLLGADLLVVMKPSEDGRTVRLRASDVELRSTSELRVESADLRSALLRAVAELTGATARIEVTSTPTGATVMLDGNAVGTTPWSATLPIGAYDLALELDGHYRRDRRIELRAGDALQHRVPLERRFATLIVRSATEGARITIRGEDSTNSLLPGEPIDLDPGTWIVETDAPGYTSRRQEISLIAGEDREIRMNLLVSPATLAARRRDRILARPLKLQAGATFASAADSGEGLSGTLLGGPQSIACVRSADGECTTRTVTTLAVDVDAIHTWNIFELQVLGGSFALLPAATRDATLDQGRGEAELASGSQVEIRFLQPGVRYLANAVFEPHVRVGPAILSDGFTVTDPLDPSDEDRFRRTRLHVQLHGGLRIHLNPLAYVFTDLHWSAPLGPSPASRFGASAGMGISLPDVFGINTALDRAFFEPDAPRASREVPRELDTPEDP